MRSLHIPFGLLTVVSIPLLAGCMTSGARQSVMFVPAPCEVPGALRVVPAATPQALAAAPWPDTSSPTVAASVKKVPDQHAVGTGQPKCLVAVARNLERSYSAGYPYLYGYPYPYGYAFHPGLYGGAFHGFTGIGVGRHHAPRGGHVSGGNLGGGHGIGHGGGHHGGGHN